MLTGNKYVDEIAQIHIEGDVIPPSWYQHVRYTNKRGTYTNHLAVAILGEIVYWYRPKEIRDEETGVINHVKKFKADLLQKSYRQLSDNYGATETQTKDAVNLLEELGLIIKNFRHISVDGKPCSNVLYIQPVPERIKAITYRYNRIPQKKGTDPTEIIDIPSELNHADGCARNHVDDLGEIRETYTETTNKNYGGGKEAPTPSFSFDEGMKEEISEFISLWNQEFEGRSEQIKSQSLRDLKTISQFIENSPEWRDYLTDGIKGYLGTPYASQGKTWGYFFHENTKTMLEDKAYEYRAKQQKSAEPPDEYGLTEADYCKAEDQVKLWIRTGRVERVYNGVPNPALAMALRDGYSVEGSELTFYIKSKFEKMGFDLYDVLTSDAYDLYKIFLSKEKKAQLEHEKLERAKSIDFSEQDKTIAKAIAQKYDCNCLNEQILSPKFVYLIKLHQAGVVELKAGKFASGNTKFFLEKNPLKPTEELVILPYYFEDAIPQHKKEVLDLMEHFESADLLTKN